MVGRHLHSHLPIYRFLNGAKPMQIAFRWYQKKFVAMTMTLSILSMSAAMGQTTFEVTKNYYGTNTDTGTLAWAIHSSNTTAGRDTINIAAGMRIDVGYTAELPYADGQQTWLAKFTDSVDVNGNGSWLELNPSYIASNAVLHTKTNPEGYYGNHIHNNDIMIERSVSFAQLSNSGASNAGLDVKISNLNADGLASFIQANEGSTLTVDGGDYVNMVSYFGTTGVGLGRPVIEGKPGTVLNLDGVNISNHIPWASPLGPTPNVEIFSGSIAGNNSTLNMSNSQIDKSHAVGAIMWDGGTANIVSSIISDAGGVSVMDSDEMDGLMNVYNSLIYMTGGETLEGTNRLQAASSGEMNVVASTVLFDGWRIDTGNPDYGNFDGEGNGMPLSATLSGVLRLESSAIVPITNYLPSFSGGKQYIPRSYAYSEFDGGNLLADQYSFVSSTSTQDSAAIKTLFNNSNVRTEGDSFMKYTDVVRYYFGDLPNGAYPLLNGSLIKVIPNAGLGGANKLINPIDGSEILYDLYGNARSRYGYRDIGAVQYGPTAVPEPVSFGILTTVGVIIAARRKRRQR